MFCKTRNTSHFSTEKKSAELQIIYLYELCVQLQILIFCARQV